jgi:hypothetical protein
VGFPDAWIIIVDNENNFHRIFAQYRADGFSAGMHSKVSSGFNSKDVTERENEYMITQQSGTCYTLRKNDEGLGDSYMRSELNNILSRNERFSITNIGQVLAKKDISIEDIENELVAFFKSNDDMDD